MTAALAEEAAAAAEAMREQAQTLADAVAVFRTGAQEGARAVRPAAGLAGRLALAAA